MAISDSHPIIPFYSLEPDEVTGSRHFRMYHYDGNFPTQSELLIPHRKNHYLLVLVRRASSRQWIDMKPYMLKDNTFYIMGPNQIILKEEAKQSWSVGIGFTKEFLSVQENMALETLPVIQNPQHAFEIKLTQPDVDFIEDMMAKINVEYQQPGEWEQRMTAAHLTVLLTYLSRLYTLQYAPSNHSDDKLLIQRFLDEVNACFRELHGLSDYASKLHVSTGYLSEIVKAQSGKPASKHIHERLILEARRLLVHTQQSSKEIAFYLGFADSSHFNRFFKRETGTTPLLYRNVIREMYNE